MGPVLRREVVRQPLRDARAHLADVGPAAGGAGAQPPDKLPGKGAGADATEEVGLDVLERPIPAVPRGDLAPLVGETVWEPARGRRRAAGELFQGCVLLAPRPPVSAECAACLSVQRHPTRSRHGWVTSAARPGQHGLGHQREAAPRSEIREPMPGRLWFGGKRKSQESSRICFFKKASHLSSQLYMYTRP